MPDLLGRIEPMFRRDRIVAWCFVIALITTIGWVFIGTLPFLAGTGAVWPLAASGLVLIVFNAASIGAMIRHYREDKEFIYTLDLKHLDEYRVMRDANRAVGPRQ